MHNSQSITTDPLLKDIPPMKEGAFWFIIACSLDNSSNEEEQYQYFMERLKSFAPEYIISFKLRLEMLIHALLSRPPFHLLAFDCPISNKGFSYKCYWYVARGEEVYYHYLSEDYMKLLPPPGNYKFESLMRAPNQAFMEKTGKNITDYIDDDALAGYQPELDD